MTSSAVLDSYADRVDSKVDPSNLLGRLIWCSLSEVRVPHDDFVKMVTAAAVSAQPPAKPQNLDVFKRVCSAVKRQKIPTNDPDIFENYRMVEFRDDGTVTRRVIQERVNNAGRKLGFAELFDVIYDRETSDLAFKNLNGFRFRDNTTPASIRDEVIDEYYLWQGCLNGVAIRSWIRAHILSLSATMVRPGGGIYFLRETHRGEIDALEQVGDQLAGYTVVDSGKVEFHSLPLIDDRKQRDMIQKAFEAETIGAVDELITEITDLSVAGKKITADRYAQFVDRFQDLTGRTEEYEELLEKKLADTATRLEIFQRSLLNLRKNVKIESPK